MNNRGKYNKGDSRNLKDRDRSYDRGISRDRENRGRLSMNRRDSALRNRGRLTCMVKVKREGVIIKENQDILCGSVNKEKGSR